MSNRRVLAVLLFTLALGVVFFYSFNPLKESDSFYHLRTGQLIWETMSVPNRDAFSYTAEGSIWVLHEWLSQLIFFAAYTLGGFWGLIAFVAGMAAATYGVLYRTALLRGADPSIAILALIAMGRLTFELWIPRPQIFSFFLLALLVYLLERYCVRAERTVAIGIVLTVWLWANIHASFIMSFIIIGIYAFIALIHPRAGDARAPHHAKQLLLIGLAALAVAVVNPTFFFSFRYIFAIQDGVALFGVQEWKPITEFLARPESWTFLASVAIGLGVAVWLYGVRKETRDMSAVVLAAMFASLPFIAIRYVGYWPIVVSPIIAGALTHIVSWGRVRIGGTTRMMLLIPLLALLVLVRIPQLPRTYHAGFDLPIRAADFIAEQDLRGRIFNLYNHGGYFIWRFWPDEQVAIDGRSEVYAHGRSAPFFTMLAFDEGADQLFDETYRVNTVVLAPYPPSIVESTRRLAAALLIRGWVPVYWDDSAVVFARDVSEHEAVIEQYALRSVHPWRSPKAIPREQLVGALNELERLVREHPESYTIDAYTREFLAVHAAVGVFGEE